MFTFTSSQNLFENEKRHLGNTAGMVFVLVKYLFHSSNVCLSYIPFQVVIFHRYMNPHNDEIPVGLIAHWLDRCTSIAVMDSNPVQA